MRDQIKKVAVIAAILLLSGCTGTSQADLGSGVLLKNELSSEQMQPGGTVLLRTSVNNFFDNELQEAQAKLTRSFGQLTFDTAPQTIGTVQANPNATARTQWQIEVKQSASSGTVFTNKVRFCFKYNQSFWHELALVNSFDIESLITQGADTGPLTATFSGLEMPYIYNEDIQSQIPISISLKNNYAGYIGTIDMSKDAIPTLDYLELRIYDSESTVDNGSPEHFSVISQFVNPKCTDPLSYAEEGCLICRDELYVPCDDDHTDECGYIRCYADELDVFGEETFLGVKLDIKEGSLDVEELIQLAEVLAVYDYCVESEDFNLEVFLPGGN